MTFCSTANTLTTEDLGDSWRVESFNLTTVKRKKKKKGKSFKDFTLGEFKTDTLFFLFCGSVSLLMILLLLKIVSSF